MITPIAFVGDSITEEWANIGAGTFKRHGFIGQGISGETTRLMRVRLRHVLVTNAVKGLHLMGGINDIAQNEGYVPVQTIKANLAAMMDEARDLGVKTWVASITPCAHLVWAPHVAPGPIIADFNGWLQEHAHEHGATFIDYHQVLATETGALRDEYGTDGAHLKPAGYEAIEPVLLAALRPKTVSPKSLASRTFARLRSLIRK